MYLCVNNYRQRTWSDRIIEKKIKRLHFLPHRLVNYFGDKIVKLILVNYKQVVYNAAIILQLLFLRSVSLKSFKTKPVYSNDISNSMPQKNEHVTSVYIADCTVH